MKRTLSLIWKEFIYGGHLQCLGVLGIVYVSSFLLDIKISWEILLLAYLIFYPIYINDRLRWIELDESTNLERTKHLKGYLPLAPKIISFSVLALAVLLIYIGNLKLAVFSFALLLLGFLYPFYFKNLTKKIVAFKNFYVAAFFTIITLLPIIYHPQPMATSSIILLTSLMLLIFSKTVLMQIFLDCKDIDNDKSLGLLTIPALIGKEKTLAFLKIGSAFVTILILFISIFFIRDFPLQMLMLFLVVPFNFYSYNLARKQNYFGYILASGEFLLWPILILMAEITMTIT